MGDEMGRKKREKCSGEGKVTEKGEKELSRGVRSVMIFRIPDQISKNWFALSAFLWEREDKTSGRRKSIAEVQRGGG